MRRMRGGMRGWDRRNRYDDWKGVGLWCTMVDWMAKGGVAVVEICLIC